MLGCLPPLARVAPETSTCLSPQDQSLACSFLSARGRCPFVSGRAEACLCLCPRSIFEPSAPPLCSLPLSPGRPQCLPLIGHRKFPLSSCLFPLLSQVPTGTWEVGCAQRLERKLQQDNSEGQCSVDVISTSLLRPEVVFFFSSIFLQVTLLLHPAQCLSACV